jgi:hypothetical protein
MFCSTPMPVNCIFQEGNARKLSSARAHARTQRSF